TATLCRLRLQAGGRPARLLSGAPRPRGRAGPGARPVSARSERYLEEMGLAPVWRLRGRREARPGAPQVEVPASTAPAPVSMGDDKVRLEPSWKARLLREFSQPYMRALREFLKKEIQARKLAKEPRFPRGLEPDAV